jgi:hypothetical protein
MMDLVQQARYLASNSGGSWFNSAFSYQVSNNTQGLEHSNSVKTITAQHSTAQHSTAQESIAPQCSSWQALHENRMHQLLMRHGTTGLSHGVAAASAVQQAVTSLLCHLLCSTPSPWRHSLGRTYPHRT